MEGMFSNAYGFNQDISSWDTARVKAMGWMFYQAEAFHQNLSGWDVSDVSAANTKCMFWGSAMENEDGSWPSGLTYSC